MAEPGQPALPVSSHLSFTVRLILEIPPTRLATGYGPGATPSPGRWPSAAADGATSGTARAGQRDADADADADTDAAPVTNVSKAR